MWNQLPLRLRLTAAFGLGTAIMLAVLGWLLYIRMGAELLRGIDSQLRARAGVIVSELERRSPATIDAGSKLIDPDEAFAQILDRTGTVEESTSAVKAGPMLPPGSIARLSQPTFASRRVAGVDDPARLLAVPAGPQQQPLIVVVGATLGDRSEALDRLLLLLAVAGPLALLAASALGWIVAGAALRPVERIRLEAAAISESEPDRRLFVPPTGDELARLAATLNGMLDRLQEALSREQRFVDEASHELRTPLAVLKAELDLAVARPRSAAELQDTVRAAAVETDELIQLAEDLLVLARTNRGRLPLRRTAVSLRALLMESAAPFRAQDAEGQPRVIVVAPDDLVFVDPVRVRQAVHNLLANAVRHGGGSTPITVRGTTHNGEVRVAVTDGGAGLPREIVDLAFGKEVHGARLRRGHPLGLGLVVVRAVAEAHGGYAMADNCDGGGARVVIVLAA